MFLDREQEIAWLNDGWPPSRGQPQLRILYGRRRVGKSALLDEFARAKRCVVFQAVEGTSADQLRDLTTAILACEDDPVLRAAPLATWDAALAYLARMAAAGPLLVIFDEYQYVAEAEPTLASRLQRWWSREVASRAPLYLVLCGSYIRFFVKNVLTGPAYGRNTGAWQLRPLGFRQAGAFFPQWAPEDRIRAYAIVGGVPHYLGQLDPGHTLAWNVAHRVLRRGTVLYQEAELLLREELREPRVYHSILRAIADGCTRVSEISERVRPFAASTDVTPYLATLQELGLAEHQRPLVGRAARRGIWQIADPYLRFWFRFVVPNRGVLEHDADPERVFGQLVRPALDEFVSRPAFEEICRSWVLSHLSGSATGVWLNVEGAGRVGAWWGPVPDPAPDAPRRQREAELEVVAAQGDRVLLAGEAKWTREPVGFGALNRLRQVAGSIPGAGPQTQLVLFGRSFDPRLAAAAAEEGVTLVSPAELFGSDGTPHN